jgi:MFS transporter, putative metabolite transport protein
MTKNISIEDVPLNGFHQLLSIRSGGGWVLDGYVLSIIGVAMVQFSAALIGIFCGGFLGGRAHRPPGA